MDPPLSHQMPSDDTITPSTATPPPGTQWADQGLLRLLVSGFAQLVGVQSSATRRVEERLTEVEKALARIEGVVAPLARERVAAAGAVLALHQQSAAATAAADEEVSHARNRVRIAKAETQAEVAELRSAALDTAGAGLRATGGAFRLAVAPYILAALAAGAALGSGGLPFIERLLTSAPLSSPVGDPHGQPESIPGPVAP